MKRTNQRAVLMEKIVALENKQAQELQELKAQFEVTYNSLKPFNFIKSTLHDITTSPDIRSEILAGTINLATGYLSKKMFFGNTNNPVKKVLGNVFKFVIKNIVGKKQANLLT